MFLILLAGVSPACLSRMLLFCPCMMLVGEMAGMTCPNIFDIACWHFSSMSFSNALILSMYDASWGDGWNDLSMSIGLTRYSPDSVWTRDRTTYSQFLNIAAKLPVGHDDTIMFLILLTGISPACLSQMLSFCPCMMLVEEMAGMTCPCLLV